MLQGVSHQEDVLGEFDTRRDLSIIKVKGENNVTDGLTKHVDRSKFEKHMKQCGLTFAMGDMSFVPTLYMSKLFVK